MLESFDFTPFAGIPCTLYNIQGDRCDFCGSVELNGGEINYWLQSLAEAVASSPGELTGPHARFLRKRLRLSPQELFEEYGDDITVSAAKILSWESGEGTIPSHFATFLRWKVLPTFWHLSGGMWHYCG